MFRDLIGTPKAKASSPDAPQHLAAGPSPARSNSETILGTDTHCEGTLTSKGNIRVDGTFLGDITTEGRVALGSESTVEGDIIGDSISVGGIVRGNITARKISIVRTGRVWGDLQLEQLATEEGSFIQGMITMQEKLNVCAAIEEAKARREQTSDASEEIEEKRDLLSELEPVPAKMQYRSHRNTR